jgi:hypothetical protein
MPNFREHIEFAERYVSLAEDKPDSQRAWLTVPATIMAWIAIESFINNMIDDFASLPKDMFSLHEMSFMLEKPIKFIGKGENLGKFEIEHNRSEYRRLEEKIYFLIAKFSSKATAYKGSSLWQNFEKLQGHRNILVHPRKGSDNAPSLEQAEQYIKTSKEVIQFVSQHVWSKDIDF